MGIPDVLVQQAAVTTVTLRRLPSSATGHATQFLVVEVLAPDRRLVTGSLVQEAEALVASGLVTDEAARHHVRGYG